MKINDGGPAFPTHEDMQEGMTLRDHFAGLAMQALLARTTYHIEDAPRDIAEEAYDYADAMLKAREAETQQEKLLAGYEMARLQAIAERARRMNGRVE
jgi:hypothetical protein